MMMNYDEERTTWTIDSKRNKNHLMEGKVETHSIHIIKDDATKQVET
jgi:hypothetical protein